MEAKHTPGPWDCGKVMGKSGAWYVHAETAGNACGRIADVPWRKSNEQTTKDAQLIAAAPELLEAAKWALAQREYFEVAEAVRRQGGSPHNGGVWGALENAIRKAEGRA